MKQKLILLLKTLFASKGFSQKALEGLADYLAPNLTEESTDADLTAAIEGIKPMTDVMQSEISRQVNDAKKPAPVDPKPIDPIDPVKPIDPAPITTDPVLLALLNEVKGLAQGLQAIKTEKVVNTRREQYSKTLEGTSDAFKAKALKDFDRINFESDDIFNEFITESTEDAKGFIQDEANSALGGDRPNGGVRKPITGEKEVSPAMKELIAEREAKAKAVTA